jgi:branched-chain amino acid transport system substrate-binding protein
LKHQRGACIAALVALVAFVAAACSGGGGDDGADRTTSTTTDGAQAGASSNARGNVDGKLVIGKLLPQTGQQSARFAAVDTPIDMALAEINAAGGVNGRHVTVVAGDDGTSADVAIVSLERMLAEDKADVILGPASSATALGIMTEIRDGEVVTCSGSNTSPDLTFAESNGYYLRTAPPDKLQGPALAQLVAENGRTRVAVLTRNDSYGRGFGNALVTSLADRGIAIVHNAAYDFNAPDFVDDVRTLKESAPDAVVVIGFTNDGGRVLRELVAQGFGPQQVATYTADGMQGQTFYTAVDAANPAVVAGIRGTAPAAAPRGIDHPFYAEYAKTGQDTIFSSHYYDCTMLVALAAVAAGSDDPGVIRKYIIDVSSGGRQCRTYVACVVLLDRGIDIDYEGASGPVDLDQHREPTVGVYDVWQYDATGTPVEIPGKGQIRVGPLRAD